MPHNFLVIIQVLLAVTSMILVFVALLKSSSEHANRYANILWASIAVQLVLVFASAAGLLG